jgi:glycosyltransferase involved in cell wall biosynthesis
VNERLVSIVVVCHNYGAYLAKAIESALDQTYPRCEVVVLDDGSTDDSVAVAGRYADSIRLLTQPNAGVQRTVNRGAAEARGQYLAFLAADDWFEPTYVEELMAGLAQSPEASFAYCGAELFGAESGVAPARPFSPFSLVRGRNYINGSALTMRADYLAVGGYREDVELLGFDDWDFWLRMVEHGKRGTYVPRPLLHWRRHAEGSRNPRSADEIERARSQVRDLHGELFRAVGEGGTLSYLTIDRGVGAADRLLGISRRQRILRTVEDNAWRRFLEARARAEGPQ